MVPLAPLTTSSHLEYNYEWMDELTAEVHLVFNFALKTQWWIQEHYMYINMI